MVWPIMGDACRRSIHLKDGVEASQRVRRSGRSAPSSTLAFNEQSGNCSGPEVGIPVSSSLPFLFNHLPEVLHFRADAKRHKIGTHDECPSRAYVSSVHFFTLFRSA